MCGTTLREDIWATCIQPLVVGSGSGGGVAVSAVPLFVPFRRLLSIFEVLPALLVLLWVLLVTDAGDCWFAIDLCCR